MMCGLRERLVIVVVLLVVLMCQPSSSLHLRHYRQTKDMKKCLLQQAPSLKTCKLGDDDPEASKFLKGIAIKSLCDEDRKYLVDNDGKPFNDALYQKCCNSKCSDADWRLVLLNRFLNVLSSHM